MITWKRNFILVLSNDKYQILIWKASVLSETSPKEVLLLPFLSIQLNLVGPVCSTSHQNWTKFWLALPTVAWGLVFVLIRVWSRTCSWRINFDFLNFLEIKIYFLRISSFKIMVYISFPIAHVESILRWASSCCTRCRNWPPSTRTTLFNSISKRSKIYFQFIHMNVLPVNIVLGSISEFETAMYSLMWKCIGPILCNYGMLERATLKLLQNCTQW